MTTLKSYDLNGKKLSFANWVSNISPEKTPFVSMTGKESIDQTLFHWQTDTLSKAGRNTSAEGSRAGSDNLRTTSIKQNITQILRRVVKVSDTANSLAEYGRGRELQYQLEKASKEIKRDLEWAFLNNSGAQEETIDRGRLTAGIHGLVAPIDLPCRDTNAVVHKKIGTSTFNEAHIFDMTYNLYLAGSTADIIMYHPKHAKTFSMLQEANTSRKRIFEDVPNVSFVVNTIIDPLGRVYTLLPNRWMPESKVYFFNPEDFTQMILRAPQRTKLSKGGSYEKWMIEMEVGLRLRHPYAAGVLDLNADHTASNTYIDPQGGGIKMVLDGKPSAVNLATSSSHGSVETGESVAILFKTAEASKGYEFTVSVLKDGSPVWSKYVENGALDHSANPLVITESATVADAGNYTLQITKNRVGTLDTHGFGLSIIGFDGGEVALPVSEVEVVEPVVEVTKKAKKPRKSTKKENK